MPIYAYKCESCGHRKDVLQKLSDPLLTVCPACGASAFSKQVTAAGFQLKGSGWYVTDFRDGGGKKPAADKGGEESGAQSGDKAADKPADKASDKAADGSGGSAEAKPAATGDASGAKTASTPTPTPATPSS